MRFLSNLLPIVPLLIAGGVILSQHLHSVLTWPGLETIVLSRLIEANEQDYLLRMRDTHLGCQTVQARQPDVVFIGDSHSYAGYDYVHLQDALRPARVGNCALSGMRLPNVLDFLAAAKTNGVRPKYLVLGISPAMFWSDDRRIGLTARARREIAKIGAPKESVISLASGSFREIEDFRDASAARSAQAAFERGIAGLDPSLVDDLLAQDTSGIYAFDWWRETVRKAVTDERRLPVIEQICRAATRNGVKLGVVYIPESRWLLSLLSDEQRREFAEVESRFRACADWTDFSFFPDGGPNIWYVNRALIPDYPYEVWSDLAAARRWVGNGDARRRWRLFDPDHMNSLGASEFSRRIAPELAAWLRRTNATQ